MCKKKKTKLNEREREKQEILTDDFAVSFGACSDAKMNAFFNEKFVFVLKAPNMRASLDPLAV